MKVKTLFALALFILFGCAKPQSSSMTSQEQEAAKKELAQVVNAIVQGLEKMDAEVLFQSYANSPDFILFTTDGTMANYQMAKNHNSEWFNGLSSLHVTTAKEEFRILTDNVAVCAWHATFDMTFKAGGSPKMDFAITFIFNKMEHYWKVVYQQTSILPPAPYKPTK